MDQVTDGEIALSIINKLKADDCMRFPKDSGTVYLAISSEIPLTDDEAEFLRRRP